MVEGGVKGAVYLRSLETKFLFLSSSTICLVTDSKMRLCVLLTGQHIQKAKKQFSLCSESFKIIFLLMTFSWTQTEEFYYIGREKWDLPGRLGMDMTFLRKKIKKSTNLSYPRMWYSVATSQNSCPNDYTFFKLASLPVPVLLAHWICMNYTGAHQFFVYISKWDSLSVLRSETLFSVWLLQQLRSQWQPKQLGTLSLIAAVKKAVKRSCLIVIPLLYFYQLWLSTLVIVW